MLFWHLVHLILLYLQKEEKSRSGEKFGKADPSALKKLDEYKAEMAQLGLAPRVVWIHAVSVGESLSVLEFTKQLSLKNYFVVFTTTNVKASRLICCKLPKHCVHQYSPYPCIRYVKKFVRTWGISKTFFAESEIFPNVIWYLHKKHIDVFLPNARISYRSAARWSKIKWFIKWVLKKYACIYASSEIEAQKFKKLSDWQANIKYFGNLKIEESLKNKDKILSGFESPKPSSVVEKCKSIRQLYKNKTIIVFGSIHETEFFHLIWQFTMILKKLNCVGIFAPRHLEEKYKLTELINTNDLSFATWSTFSDTEMTDTLIIDDFGILPYLYNIADFSVICGSFVAGIGGHNPFESIALGKLTFIGKFCEKEADIIANLITHNAIIQTSHLSNDLLNLANDSKRQQSLIQNGNKVVEENSNVISQLLVDMKL